MRARKRARTCAVVASAAVAGAVSPWAAAVVVVACVAAAAVVLRDGAWRADETRPAAVEPSGVGFGMGDGRRMIARAWDVVGPDGRRP